MHAAEELANRRIVVSPHPQQSHAGVYSETVSATLSIARLSSAFRFQRQELQQISAGMLVVSTLQRSLCVYQSSCANAATVDAAL